MCPPCVIRTTHNAVTYVLHVIQKLFVQTCVSTGVWRLCVFDRVFFCEAVTSSFLCPTRYFRSLSLVFLFLCCYKGRSLVPEKYDLSIGFLSLLFLLWREEWCCCESGSAFVFEVHTGSPVSPCVVSFSNVEFYPLCPLCGPKVHRNPTQHCRVKWKISQAVNVSVSAFFKLYVSSRLSVFFLFHLNAFPSIHPFACMLTTVPRCCIGSTFISLSLIYFNPFNLLFSD